MSQLAAEEKLCTFFVHSFAAFVDFGAELKGYQVALSPQNNKLAVATARHLLISDDRDFSALTGAPPPRVETLMEFSKASGKCTALLWLTNEAVCLGFESGDFAVFDSDGKGVTEQRCHASSVQALRLSESLLPGIYGHTEQGSSYAGLLLRSMGAADPTDVPAGGASLWVLHAEGVLAVVPVSSLLAGDVGELIRFQLLHSTAAADFVLLPTQSHSRNPFITIDEDESTLSAQACLTGGADSTLSLYSLGGAQHFEHFGKFAEYVQSRTVGLVTRTFMSFWSSSSADKEAQAGYVDLTKGPVVPAPSLLDFRDPGRKVMRMSLDPTGRCVRACVCGCVCACMCGCAPP